MSRAALVSGGRRSRAVGRSIARESLDALRMI